MENYAWLEEELKSISCHYVYTDDAYMQAWLDRHPGEALPPRELPTDLISEMIRRRPQHRITYYLKQMSVPSLVSHSQTSNQGCFQCGRHL